jgi:hypothetical protein
VCGATVAGPPRYARPPGTAVHTLCLHILCYWRSCPCARGACGFSATSNSSHLSALARLTRPCVLEGPCIAPAFGCCHLAVHIASARARGTPVPPSRALQLLVPCASSRLRAGVHRNHGSCLQRNLPFSTCLASPHIWGPQGRVSGLRRRLTAPRNHGTSPSPHLYQTKSEIVRIHPFVISRADYVG